MKIATKGFLYFLIVIGFFSCKRMDEKVTTDPNAFLSFSSEAIILDTVLSGIERPHITERLVVFNRNKNAVIISNIYLGNPNSPFSIYVNGILGNASNIELRGGDSLFVLVTVKLPGGNIATPYLVRDSIIFNTNGNFQKIHLIAFGKDANIVKTPEICGIWSDSLPYILYQNTTVPAGCTLTIKKGVRVLFGRNVYLNVHGTLLIEGTSDSSGRVLLDSDRFGGSKLPGEWGGIIFSETSKGNSIKFASIQNGIIGVEMRTMADDDTIPELEIRNSIIRNMSRNGLVAYGADILAYNTLITNAPGFSVAGLGGGNYHFYHCTFTSYSYDFFRDSPVAIFSNKDITSNSRNYSSDIKVKLANSIIWGDGSNELILEEGAGNLFSLKVDSSIIKSTHTIDGSKNLNPLFVKPSSQNFRLQDGSPAINSGIEVIGLSTDIEGKPRMGLPDIGAYEKQ